MLETEQAAHSDAAQLAAITTVIMVHAANMDSSFNMLALITSDLCSNAGHRQRLLGARALRARREDWVSHGLQLQSLWRIPTAAAS